MRQLFQILESLAVARELGINTIKQMEAILLVHKETSIPMGELGQRVGLTSAAMTGMVDALTKAGILERIGTDDRRTWLIALTAHGDAAALRIIAGVSGKLPPVPVPSH